MGTDVIDSLAVPPRVKEALRRLRTELAEAAGNNLTAILLFGGIARGRYVEARSDVNLVVVLKDASAANLASVAPPLRAARRAIRAEALLLAESEVPRATDVFPTKFLEIQAHHLTLAGRSPFELLTVPRAHQRLRVEQELRNLLLRLRKRYVTALDEPTTLGAALTGAVSPLAVGLGALLSLSGHPLPPDDEDAPSAVFSRAAVALGLDALALTTLAALKLEAHPAPDPALFPAVLATLARAVQLADELPE
jgi:predicted nucleotidyltransferase